MTRRLVAVLAVSSVIVGTACLAFFVGYRHARGATSIDRVTASEIANAMKADRFYADYGHRVLLVDGIVSSVSVRGSESIVSFKTGSSFQAKCALGVLPTSLRVDKPITVIAVADDAEREPSAVLLHAWGVP